MKKNIFRFDTLLCVRLGLWLCVTGIAVGSASSLMALEPVQFGIWPQIESVIAALFLGGMISGLGVLCVAAAKPHKAGLILGSPVVAVPLAMALWTGLLSPFAAVPMLSWFGNPIMGQGVLSWLCVAMFSAAALWLRGWRRIMRGFVWGVVGLFFLIAGLTFAFGKGSPYAPLWFGDYLAFPALFLPAILIGWARLRQPWILYGSVLVGMVVILLSKNQTTLGALFVFALPLIVLVWVMTRYNWLLRFGSVRFWAAACLLLVPVSAMIAIGIVDEWSNTNAMVERILVTKSTLADRILITKTIISAMIDQPLRFVTGMGWGHFQDLLMEYLLVENVPLHVDTVDERELWQWGAVEYGYAHSHNDFVEALMAGGVGALLLYGIYIIIPVLVTPRSLLLFAVPISAAYAGTLTIWFQMPGILVFMALGFTGFAGPLRPWWKGGFGSVKRLEQITRNFGAFWIRIRRPLIGMILGFVVLVLGLGTGWQVELSIRGENAGRLPVVQWLDIPQTCPNFMRDGGRGGFHLESFLGHIFTDFAALRQREEREEIRLIEEEKGIKKIYSRYREIGSILTGEFGSGWNRKSFLIEKIKNSKLYAELYKEFFEKREILINIRKKSKQEWIEKKRYSGDLFQMKEFTPPNFIPTLRMLVCSADRWLEEKNSLRLAIVSVLARSEVAFLRVGEADRADQAAILADWEPILMALLARAPARVDLSIPYYAWRIGHNEETEALAFAERRLVLNPQDPVALWYSGSILLADVDREQEGIKRMGRALALNLRQIMPVSKEWIEIIQHHNRWTFPDK